jgi:hypothetical protein
MYDEKYLDTIEMIDSHLVQFVDEDEVVIFEDSESEIHPVDIYWIKPNMEYRPYSILMTCGMSRFAIAVPDEFEDERFLEIAMLFPKSWDFDNISSKPETITWPIQHLRTIGKMQVVQDTWLGLGHTVLYKNGNDEFFPGTRFNSTIIFQSITLPKAFTEIENGDDVVKIYSAVPLYPEELRFKLEKDSDLLIERFDKFNIQEVVDVNRINTCK